MVKVLLDRKNGTVWDLSDIISSLTWTTARTGKPADVEFSFINNGIYQDTVFGISNGDIIRVRKDDTNVFQGYVFSIGSNPDGEFSVKAYDQVRYLLNKGRYVLKNITATEVIQQIANDFGLKTGTLADSDYVIPAVIEDNQMLLDIIEKALTLTLYNTQKHFVFYDDFGSLSLRLVDETLTDFYIGDGSLMTGYDYSADIDSDTFNQIILYKDIQNSGRREYGIKDSNNIAKWGLLQLYQSVDEKKNEAQIQEMLNQLIQLKNRETKTLKVEAVGDIRVRAGIYLRIHIDSLDLNQPMLVNEVKHQFSGEDHTMSLTLKVI